MNANDLLLRQQALLQALTAVRAPAGAALPPNLMGQRVATAAEADAALARGLQAYRVNAQVLADKVLGQTFPALRQELGEASFEQMAWACWRQRPPTCGDLGRWGAVLPAFLADQAGMDAWMVDLARLEWALHELEGAPDQHLQADSLGLLSECSPDALTLSLRAGSQVLSLAPQAWFSWLAANGRQDAGLRPDESGASVELLLWRPQWRAECRRLPRPEAVFMRCLLAKESLEQALMAASAAAQDEHLAEFDFAQCLQGALRDAWLHAVRRLPPQL